MGLLALQAMESINADLAFIGSSDFRNSDGPCVESFQEAAVKQAMIRHAAVPILLADSTKADWRSMERIFPYYYRRPPSGTAGSVHLFGDRFASSSGLTRGTAVVGRKSRRTGLIPSFAGLLGSGLRCAADRLCLSGVRRETGRGPVAAIPQKQMAAHKDRASGG